MTEKPISILRMEFANSLVRLINDSGLPPYVVEPILKDVAVETGRLIKEQFEKDNAEYQRALIAQRQAEEAAEKDKSSKKKK